MALTSHYDLLAANSSTNSRLQVIISDIKDQVSTGGDVPPVRRNPAPVVAEPKGPRPVIIPQYEDPTLALFTSLIQKHGHRHRAVQITTKMLLHLRGMTQSEPLPLFRTAISMASPSVRMRTIKKGSRNLSTPVALSEKQRTRAAIQWILESAGGRVKKGVSRSRGPGGHRLEQRVARVLVGILTDPTHSPVMGKKQTLHQLAVANRSVWNSGFSINVF